MIPNVVACAGVLGAAVWTAGPVEADPNYYELLSCHCLERAAPFTNSNSDPTPEFRA